MTSARDEYKTPALLIERLETYLGPFVVDLAAEPHNVIHPGIPFLTGPCQKGDGPAECYCGLCVPWAPLCNGIRGYGFLNNPYSNHSTWIAKANAEARLGAHVAQLGLPFNSDAWTETVMAKAAELWHLWPRVQFGPAHGIDPETGQPFKASSNQRGSMVTIWNDALRSSRGRARQLKVRGYNWLEDRWVGGKPTGLWTLKEG